MEMQHPEVASHLDKIREVTLAPRKRRRCAPKFSRKRSLTAARSW